MKKSILFAISLITAAWLLPGQACGHYLSSEPVAVAPLGEGTSASPYQVATLENLYWVAQQTNSGVLGGAYIIQTADIDATETSGWFEGTGWTPIGNSTDGFQGHYDGQGHVVDQLYLNRVTPGPAGLFGMVEAGATIEDLGVTRLQITGVDYVGGLAGRFSGIASGCYTTGVVNGQSQVGGLIGFLDSPGLVEDAYSRAHANGVSWIGGLLGLNYGLANQVYATGVVDGTSDVGGLIGMNLGSVSDGYWDTQASGQTSSGGGVGLSTLDMQRQASFSGFSFGPGLNWLMSPLVNDGYPALSWQQGAVQYATQPTQIGGAYQIATLSELYWITQDPARWTASYEQTTPIDATETATWCGGKGWVVVGENTQTCFSGSYNGNNFTITGLFIDRPGATNSGFFGYAEVATVSSLGLVDCNISGQNSGALMGGGFGVQIENSFSTGNVTGTGHYVGGLVGEVSLLSEIRACYSEANVLGSVDVGGLVGSVDGSDLLNCYSTGNVTGDDGSKTKSIGGLIGKIYSGGAVVKSFSTGDVSNGHKLGGFAGTISDSNSQILNCYSTGNVTSGSTTDAGGFCGSNDAGTIENSFSIGSVFNTEGEAPTGNGFIGSNIGGSHSGNFFDSGVSNQSDAVGAIPKTTAEMTRVGTFIAAGWPFRASEEAWGFNGVDNLGYPFLRHQEYQPKNLWLGLLPEDWGTAINWSEEVVPGQSAIVPQILQGRTTAVVNAPTPAQIENLTIEANAQLAIAPGGALSVTGTIINEAGTEGFTIQSDATGTGSLIHNSPNVSATVERYLMAAVWDDGKDGWHLLSSPVLNIPIVGSDFVPDPESPEWGNPGNRTFDFYAFDESAEAQGEEPPLPWINIRDAGGNLNAGFETNFIHGKGYLVAGKTTGVKTFPGELNQGAVQVPLSHTPEREYSGWNLLGNPYPSAIQWRNDYAGQFVQNPVAIYDTDREGGAGYVYILDGDYIPAHQGFFAEVNPEAGGQNFDFTNAMRAHGDNFTKGNTTTSALKAGNASAAETVSMGALSIRLRKDHLFDETQVHLHPESTPDRDRHDAAKLFSLHSGMPQLYSLTADQVHVAINAIPEIAAETSIPEIATETDIPEIAEETAIPLGFTVPEAGSYQIELGEASGAFAGHDIYLLDHQKNTQTRLSAGGHYVFAADPSDENQETNRFKIVFSLSDATPTNDRSQPNAQIYSSGQTIYVAFSGPEPGRVVEVYDLGGRLLVREAANGSGRFSIRPGLETGIYVVRVSGRDHVQVGRVFIR